MTTPSAVEREVAALRSADPAPLIAWLRRPQASDPLVWAFLWHEVSTLAGRIVGQLQIAQADQRHDAELAFKVWVVTGGAPREVVGAAMFGEALADRKS